MSRLLKISRQMTKKKAIPNECIRSASTNSEDIKNPFGVSLVAPKLHNKLFKTPYKKCTDPDKITKAEDHLKRFQILTEQSSSQRNEIIDGFQNIFVEEVLGIVVGGPNVDVHGVSA